MQASRSLVSKPCTIMELHNTSRPHTRPTKLIIRKRLDLKKPSSNTQVQVRVTLYIYIYIIYIISLSYDVAEPLAIAGAWGMNGMTLTTLQIGTLSFRQCLIMLKLSETIPVGGQQHSASATTLIWRPKRARLLVVHIAITMSLKFALFLLPNGVNSLDPAKHSTSSKKSSWPQNAADSAECKQCIK